MPKHHFTRRDFFKTSTISGASLILAPGFISIPTTAELKPLPPYTSETTFLPSKHVLDLSPARWVWFPSQRTLANTFILFRKTIQVNKAIASAKGWILGDSRYELSINGQRIQWGPAPADPRYAEADPIDLKEHLEIGENVLGVTVLYYGYGDGTWPVGKPGFIWNLEIKYADGSSELVLSDGSWQCCLARSWKPGQYKRWYLRALQEEFDARLYPHGWQKPGYSLNDSWINAEEVTGSAAKTALSTGTTDYMYDASSGGSQTELRQRSIPMMIETDHFNAELKESYLVRWKRSPYEFFEMVTPNAFEPIDTSLSLTHDAKSWEIKIDHPDEGAVLTFSLPEQVVGWPFFSIQAPEGTVVELMVQEGHTLLKDGGPAIINNHFHAWSRFVCKNGENHFQPFDFESVKWIQLHIHGTLEKVLVKNVGIKRRIYPWPYKPILKVSDQNLQKLIDASINTIYNNSQETIVDGMGRERQQYSGDIGHLLHGIYRAFGDEQLPARFVNTYSQGITLDGYFLDTWPAYDRLNRLSQRQLGLTEWGPLLDHGVGFNFDCYHLYLYTGNLEPLQEVWPRLLRFFGYLQSILNAEGLLPVENLGIPTVWIDHQAYLEQRHKQCAFNLYVVAMLQNAFSVLAVAHNANDVSYQAMEFSKILLKNTITKFWDPAQKLFVCNLPWATSEGEKRLCDRSLATALLFDLCPGGNENTTIEALVSKPANLGLSYPPNTNWYLWALAKAGRIDAVFKDFEQRWIKMDSVHLNNTMQEFWESAPDSGSQWSHASVAPLFSVYMDIAGIKPLSPGYSRFSVKPQPGMLEYIELDNHTPFGAISFMLKGKKGARELTLKIPKGTTCELILDEKEKVSLTEKAKTKGNKVYEIQGNKEVSLLLKYL